MEIAYRYFGIEEFRDVKNLHKGNLRKRIVAEEISLLKTNLEDKISTFMLNSGLLKIGDFKSTNELRSVFTTTYEYLGLSLPIKASDIKNYFIATEGTGRLVKNGTKQRGYYIVCERDKFRDVA